MDTHEIRILKEYLKEKKNLNREQFRLIYRYFIKVYLKCLITFGIQHKITKESIELFKSMQSVMNEEREILKFIKKNSVIIDCEAVDSYLDLLEKLNEVTVKYFYDCLEDLESASELKNELYSKHKTKNFKSLIETDEYRLYAASLILSFDDVKNLLGYSDEFWQWAGEKVNFNIGDSSLGMKEIKIFFDTDDNLKKINLALPKIVDYDTLNSCIIQIELAYCVFETCKNGCNISDVRVLEEEKINQYILEKYKKFKI